MTGAVVKVVDGTGERMKHEKSVVRGWGMKRGEVRWGECRR